MITAGEPVRIRSLDLALTGEAERDAPFAAALEQAGLAGGAVLNHGAYEQLKRRWSDLARERGYADAQFAVARIDVYPEEHAADIALRFDSGVRYAFGRTELTQDVLTAGLAASYLDDFREGEPYDAARLTDAYAALASSGYFETIDVRPMPADAATRTIPIAVALTSSARTQTSYGIGYSDRHGAALSLQPHQPPRQRSRPSARHQPTAFGRHLGADHDLPHAAAGFALRMARLRCRYRARGHRDVQ